MRLGEHTRKALALLGCLFWLISAFLPIFGGGAKHAVRCRDRVFTGEFDDCFNDYLPILELLAPFLALGLLWFFAKFAFAAWAPEPAGRTMRWRGAPSEGTAIFHPGYMTLAIFGCVWALWRTVLYPLDRLTLPYLAFWLSFAAWFGASAWSASNWARSVSDD